MEFMTAQWLLILIPIGMVFLAQMLLTANYKKYSKMPNSRGLSGYEVARKILDSNGLSNVEIYQGKGQLSDFFDPTRNIIQLSPDVYQGRSIASLAVAAHEVGHAIQYATNYPMIAIRNKILPASITASNIAWIVIIAGLVMTSFGSVSPLLYLGIGLMVIIALFQVATLPLEFNASSRALQILEGNNYLDYDEVPKAKKVLNSAAMTYVVALIVTIAEILRLLLIVFVNRD